MNHNDYIRLGYSVFPCSGKSPARAKTWPNDVPFVDGDNIGLIVPNGALVIDLDIKPDLDGRQLFADLCPAGYKHTGPKAQTGSGGYHLWFQAPPLLELGNSRGSLPTGIDVRGGGKGYVIAPPSTHPDTGQGYKWERPLTEVGKLPMLPDWLVEIILTPKYKPLAQTYHEPPDETNQPYLDAVLANACETIRSAPSGDRNNILNTQAFKVFGYTASGLDPNRAEQELLDAALSISGRGFEEGQIRATLRSARRGGTNSPRYAPAPNKKKQQQKKKKQGSPGPAAASSKNHHSFSGSTGTSSSCRDRATIVITTAEREVNNEAITALARANEGDLYTRANELVRVVHTTANTEEKGLRLPNGTVAIRQLSSATLRERLASAADWVKLTNTGEPIPAHPPAWSTLAVMDRGDYPGIPPVRGLASYPMIRPDGTIAQTPGYDSGTGYYLSRIPPGFEVGDKCSQSDAEHAAEKLLDLVCDFPFRDDLDRAAWLAYLLTPLARAVIHGPTPLFVIEANVRGSGKTLLADAAGLILTGSQLPAQTYARSDEELEKIIVSVARLGIPILCFDNVSGSVGGPVLDKWITSTSPTGRLLGSNELPQFDWSTVMVATGNNASVHGDTDRRSIYVTLETEHERPELRSGFTIPNLPNYLVRHRGELLSYALSILRAHHQAGCPATGGRAKGTFEAWAHRVRDAVMFAGLPDCERAADDPNRPMDSDSSELGVLLAALWEAFGDTEWRVSDMMDAAYPPDRDKPLAGAQELRNVLSQMDGRRDKPSRQLLGRRLGKYRKRWLNGKRLNSGVDSRSKQHVWRVEERKEDE